MSDTTVCPNCDNPVPATASFCTSCGHNLAAPPAGDPVLPPPPGDPGPDPTAITGLGIHDATQVIPSVEPEPAAAWAPAPTEPAPAPAWAPAADPVPEAAPPAWAPVAEPPSQPGPVWEAPPTGAAPGFTPPPAAAPPVWGDPAAATPYAQPPAAWPQPSTAGPAPTDAKPSPFGGIAGVLGGVLTLVGIFTAWIGSEGSSKTVKGWDLTSGDHFFKSQDPYLLLALGVGALVLGVALFVGKFRSIVRIASIVLGAVVIAVCVKDWSDIGDLVAKSEQFRGITVKTEFGYYLTIAGGALAIVAGLLPAKKA